MRAFAMTVLLALVSISVLGFYIFQQPHYVGKAYVIQAQSSACPSPSVVCAPVLTRCDSAPDPCSGDSIPCSWRLGPVQGVFPGKKSGCFKTCFNTGSAILKECV